MIALLKKKGARFFGIWREGEDDAGLPSVDEWVDTNWKPHDLEQIIAADMGKFWSRATLLTHSWRLQENVVKPSRAKQPTSCVAYEHMPMMSGFLQATRTYRLRITSPSNPCGCPK